MRKNKNNPVTPDYTGNIPLAPYEDNRNRTTEYVKRSVGLTFKYFGAKLLTSAIIGVIEWLVCRIIGIPGAVAYGIIACVCNLIPYVGSWVSGIIIGVICVFIKPIFALYALIALIAAQMLEQFIFTPLIVGQALSVKPVLIVLITLTAGSLFGFWGILFAVPIAAIIKLGYQIYFQRKSFAEIDSEKRR